MPAKRKKRKSKARPKLIRARLRLLGVLLKKTIHVYRRRRQQITLPLCIAMLVLLAMVLLKNTHLFHSDETILAHLGDSKITLKNLRGSDLDQLMKLKQDHERLLHASLKSLLDQRVLIKEGVRHELLPEDLLKLEVTDTVQVESAEVYYRYAFSPRANQMPYQEALDQIRVEIYNQRLDDRKRSYMQSLYEKYKVKIKIDPPAFPNKTGNSTATPFPLYTAPAAKPEILGNRVVNPPSMGPPNAPVVMEIYSDFLCPYSLKQARTVQALRDKYPNHLRVEYRHLPLPFHKGADLMAEASICAQEQGQFWKYHDELYQTILVRQKPELAAMASKLGLNSELFQACLDSGRYRERVEQDVQRAHQNGIRGTPGNLINARLIMGARPLSHFTKVIDWLLKPEGEYPGSKAPQAAAPTKRQEPPSNTSFDGKDFEGHPSIGPKDAPVTIVEFIDFHCPFCKRSHATLVELLSEFEGQIRLVQFQFPLAIHPEASLAAKANLCADEQDGYWAFRTEAFGSAFGTKNEAGLNKIASKSGLDPLEFNRCLSSDRYDQFIKDDLALGQSKGVSGTPAFYINGHFLNGAQDISVFRKIIRDKLDKKK